MAFNGIELNIVDLLALLLLFLSVIAGIRNGFINGFLELFGLFASIYLAFKGYGPIAERLIAVAPLPKAIVNLGAFIAVFVLCQIL
ncbi:MAG: CvpA family protein, partial [Dehalococcoidia bacterium]|nr:CvpA family protein [Dehalococcoidia bacterium]